MMEQLRGNRWVTLLILSIGFLMILIDSTIVNVSIPTIIKDLSATLSNVEWVISGYALTFAALLITFGRLGDMLGRRNLFILGLVVFTVASFFSGEAFTIHTLIAARLFQGVGGAMISPATLSIISSTFKGRERGIAFGVWGAVAGVAVALGPILGGYFTTYYTWRWIFRVNIPIGIIGVIASLLVIREAGDLKPQKLDVSGMITSSIGFFLLVFGLIEGQDYGWWKQLKPFSVGSLTWDHSTSIIPATLALSGVFLLWFVILQAIKTHKGEAPAVNVDFFKHRSFRYGLVAIAVISLGEFSSLFTLPIFLQSIKGYTPLQSGYAVLPLALAVMFAAPLSGLLVNRLGSKWVVTLGITTEFLGILFLGRSFHVDSSLAHLVAPMVILGIGIGLAVSQNTQIILSQIEPSMSGSASGVLNTIRQVGSALGIALIGAVLAGRLATHVPEQINAISGLPDSVKEKIITAATSGGSTYSGTTQNFAVEVPPAIAKNPQAVQAFYVQVAKEMEAVKAGINVALTQSITTSVEFGSIFVALGALLSLLIPNIKQEKREPVVE